MNVIMKPSCICVDVNDGPLGIFLWLLAYAFLGFYNRNGFIWVFEPGTPHINRPMGLTKPLIEFGLMQCYAFVYWFIFWYFRPQISVNRLDGVCKHSEFMRNSGNWRKLIANLRISVCLRCFWETSFGRLTFFLQTSLQIFVSNLYYTCFVIKTGLDHCRPVEPGSI